MVKLRLKLIISHGQSIYFPADLLTITCLVLLMFLLTSCGKRIGSSDSSNQLIFERLEKGMPVGDWDAIESVFSGANTLSYAEVWEDTTSPNFRGAEVKTLWEPDGVWILAELQDDDIHNSATKTNDPTWEMGDVFEIFLVTPDSERYLEFHVTPNNVHLQIVWPNFQTISELRAKGVRAYDYMVEAPLLTSWVKVDHDSHQWTVLAKVKADAITNNGQLSTGMVLKTSFSRYDRFQDTDQIIFSSTSAHKKINYHIQGDWKEYELIP
jgi:hypothetical protein